jgi:L-asparaginase
MLRDRVSRLVSQPNVAGVVVTHGTDTLEESAYLLDITVPHSKPIVFTGAMRTASAVGYDGSANLAAAIRVAASPLVAGQGAVVVLNGEIHAARYVTKMHTGSLSAFESPGWGPIGRIDADSITIHSSVAPGTLPWRGLEANVPLLKICVGMDSAPMAVALSSGARGIVIEALGGGRVPPWWVDTIELARVRGLPVVIATRCASGPMGDTYGYEGAYGTLVQLGCLFADHLNGQKARIRLMVVLAAVRNVNEVAQLW